MSNEQTKTHLIKDGFFSFVFIELCVFAAQVLVFFIVAYFISDSLASKERLAEFLNGKINTYTLKELGLTLFAVTFTLGLLAQIKVIVPSSYVEKVSTEVLLELPRTIYLFGSSITASTLAIASFISSHPETIKQPASDYFWLSAFFALSLFGYGCTAKYFFLLKRGKSSAA
jgi:heme/copper-type cytochrome/quinol oxidase subunit 3